jgi:hypothetical protein
MADPATLTYPTQWCDLLDAIVTMRKIENPR